MKLLYKILLGTFAFNTILYVNADVIESQPEIIFQFEKLKKTQENLALQVDFNKAVLHLSKNEYNEAINLFKKTAKILEIPSYLNIGIAYYKLNSVDNAIVYLNKIYEKEENSKIHTFSYMSACFYLYQKNKIDTIITSFLPRSIVGSYDSEPDNSRGCLSKTEGMAVAFRATQKSGRNHIFFFRLVAYNN